MPSQPLGILEEARLCAGKPTPKITNGCTLCGETPLGAPTLQHMAPRRLHIKIRSDGDCHLRAQLVGLKTSLAKYFLEGYFVKSSPRR